MINLKSAFVLVLVLSAASSILLTFAEAQTVISTIPVGNGPSGVVRALFPALSNDQQCIPAPSGLVSWWPGDGDARDIWSGRDGTLISGATFATGKVDQAFSFDGVDDFVSVLDDEVWTLGSDPFTIDLWVNFDQLKGRDPFIGHDEGPWQYNKWIFWYDVEGHDKPSGPALRFHINSPTLPPADPVFAPWVPNLGQWYHVAVTRSGNTYALYIDGVEVATGTDPKIIPDPDAPLTIGRAEAYFLDGLIDEVEIYNRALSSQEIQAIYNAGSAGKCKGAPVPDFDIVVSPSTGTAGQGSMVTTNVYVSAIAGYDYLVSLSASGQPEGVTIDFNPNSGTPYFTSTMTIQVGDSVPPNTYTITVTGLGSDDTTHSTIYTLTVTTGPGPVPELPLGAEAAAAIGLGVAIVHVWMRRRSLKTSNTAKTL